MKEIYFLEIVLKYPNLFSGHDIGTEETMNNSLYAEIWGRLFYCALVTWDSQLHFRGL